MQNTREELQQRIKTLDRFLTENRIPQSSNAFAKRRDSLETALKILNKPRRK